MISQLSFQGLSWKILLKGIYEEKIEIHYILSAIFVGWFANFISPSMYLGGKPIRAYIITKNSGISFGKSLASVIFHKVLELSAFIFIILISTIVVFIKFSNKLNFQLKFIISFSVIFLCSVFLFIIMNIIKKKKIITKIFEIFNKIKILKNFFNKYIKKISNLEEFILNSFDKASIYIALSFLLMIIFEILIFIRPYIFFLFLNKKLNFSDLSLIFLMIQLIQAFQLTLGGLGILEGGTIGILALIKISIIEAIIFITIL